MLRGARPAHQVARQAKQVGDVSGSRTHVPGSLFDRQPRLAVRAAREVRRGAMEAGGRTWSTTPMAIAAAGMPKTTEVALDELEYERAPDTTNRWRLVKRF